MPPSRPSAHCPDKEPRSPPPSMEMCICRITRSAWRRALFQSSAFAATPLMTVAMTKPIRCKSPTSSLTPFPVAPSSPLVTAKITCGLTAGPTMHWHTGCVPGSVASSMKSFTAPDKSSVGHKMRKVGDAPRSPPLRPLSFTLKYGNALRKTSSFDTAAFPPEENLLIRDYNYAPRDRVFSTFTGAWSITAALTWSIEESLAKDDYRSSPMGLQNTHQQRVSSTLTWSPKDTLNAYLDAGYERLTNLQNGSTGNNTTPWLAGDSDRFWNVGVGGRWVPQARWTVTLDYLLAPSYDNNDSIVGGIQQAFPQNWTKLESTRLGVGYQWTAATQIHFRYTREQYNSSDWSLNGDWIVDRAQSPGIGSSALSRQCQCLRLDGAL